MSDICTDNRFEVIEKYKQKLIEATNIEQSPKEMEVLDNILFRFWQMGWLKAEVDAEPVRHGRWIPVRSSDAFGGDFVTWQAHGDPIAFHYCSKCREESRLDEFGDEILTNFCPDCGAKMDGEEE